MSNFGKSYDVRYVMVVTVLRMWKEELSENFKDDVFYLFCVSIVD